MKFKMNPILILDLLVAVTAHRRRRWCLRGWLRPGTVTRSAMRSVVIIMDVMDFDDGGVVDGGG